ARLWERYVESQTDYRAGSETLARKLEESGTDAWQLLEWLGEPAHSELASGPQAQLLARVFAEQFELQTGKTAPVAREKITVAESSDLSARVPETPELTEIPANSREVQTGTSGALTSSKAEAPTVAAAQSVAAASEPAEVAGPVPAALDSPAADASDPAVPVAGGPTELAAEVLSRPPQVQPKGSGQLDSDRVQNPHEPDATYGAKGEGEKKKEHVGYKVQIAETVCEATLTAGEPTRNFIVGIVTHPAYEHDETGAQKMEQEQAQMGLEKPPVQYVDSAYVSAQKLAKAQAEDREQIVTA